MRAERISALLLTLLLGACAEVGETSDLSPFERAGNYVSTTTGYCGGCGYGRAGAWRAERPGHVVGTGHGGHGSGRHHKHGGERDHHRR